MDILFFSQPSTGNFLVDIIAWLIKISSSIAVGVILFTVILKLITLPFDYISRASTRKNSLKMEQMRPELEKLQQQYANDKNLYQQKMMALYKKNGYSMFGACLPSILTLVIFIVAINGFTNYSRYQNKEYFYNMANDYNNVIYSGMELDESESKYVTRGAEGQLIIDGNKLYALSLEEKNTVSATDKNGESFDILFNVEKTGQTSIEDNGVKIGDKIDKKLYVQTTNSYVKATLNFTIKDYFEKEDEISFSTTYFDVLADKLTDSKLASEENNFLKMQLLNEDGSFKLDENGNKIEKTYAQAMDEQLVSDATAFILDIRQQKSADRYRAEQADFLWVKNIWVADNSFNHPVESDWEKFKQTHDYQGNDIGVNGYDSLTKKLEFEKNAPNGYFILVVLTAGSSLLMQLITSKSQKAQIELQSVDGRAMQTQKTMMIVMPIMMAVFAFMYTSAFSIYIILSSVISMLTTLGINKIVDFRFKKQLEQTEKDNQHVRGRIYTPKPEEKKQEPKNGKSKSQANEHGDNDFLSGKADGKKKIRGRIK